MKQILANARTAAAALIVVRAAQRWRASRGTSDEVLAARALETAVESLNQKSLDLKNALAKKDEALELTPESVLKFLFGG